MSKVLLSPSDCAETNLDNLSQNRSGYLRSSAVAKTDLPDVVFVSPHFKCWCELSQKVLISDRSKFAYTNLVNLGRLPPCMHICMKTDFTRDPSKHTFWKDDVCHISEFPGFSTVTCTPLADSSWNALLVNSYNLLADCTFASSTPDSDGNPSGKARLRSGNGSGPVFLRISRAREAVPHGGAKCT